MDDTLFKVLDRYGVSMVIVLILALIVWKVAPEVVKVWIDKIRAETDTIRATQKAVSETIPAAISELKTAFVAVEGRLVEAINRAVSSDTDRQIVGRLDQIERVQQKLAAVARGSIPDTEIPPPSRTPSRST
jgi:hypothetical protein